MSNYTATEKKSMFDNAINMAVRSLNLSISDIAPVNFVSGKNVTFKNQQDSRLLVAAAVEGYKTNLWATPRQIRDLNVGAIISPDAAIIPVFMEKTSKKGNKYLTSYDVVNLDCVSWPNGIPGEVFSRIREIVSNPKPAVKCSFEAPTPLVARVAPEPVKVSAPLDNDARVSTNIRENNQLSRTEKQHVGPERKANVIIHDDLNGFHIEARTTAEANFMLQELVKARLALAGISK